MSTLPMVILKSNCSHLPLAMKNRIIVSRLDAAWRTGHLSAVAPDRDVMSRAGARRCGYKGLRCLRSDARICRRYGGLLHWTAVCHRL